MVTATGAAMVVLLFPVAAIESDPLPRIGIEAVTTDVRGEMVIAMSAAAMFYRRRRHDGFSCGDRQGGADSAASPARVHVTFGVGNGLEHLVIYTAPQVSVDHALRLDGLSSEGARDNGLDFCSVRPAKRLAGDEEAEAVDDRCHPVRPPAV